MSVINYKKANCVNCYRCIRECPVKAIRMKDEQAEIIEDACISCGICLKSCPQNAKSIRNDVGIVKELIENKQDIYVSLAPSFMAAFDVDHPGKIISGLNALGLKKVQETSLGALLVSKEYKRLFDKNDQSCFITTACPTVNSLVQQYYPDVVDCLAPVVSPMLAHAKLLKQKYGQNIRVVFIGPCVAKKQEVKEFQNDQLVDAVLTFKELQEWFDQENISLNDLPEKDFLNDDTGNAKFYPVPGGVIKTVFNSEKSFDFNVLSISGIEECMEVFELIEKGELNNMFIEANACAGGCLNGPALPANTARYHKVRKKLLGYAYADGQLSDFTDLDLENLNLKKIFFAKPNNYKVPSEDEIKEILAMIGKVNPTDELNCGACGYNTCREKAIAVYQGKAELYMCMPYMRERAESISNIIIRSTPNGIIAVDQNMQVQEFNCTAEQMFNVQRQYIVGKNIIEIIDDTFFRETLDTGKNIFNKKVTYPEYDITTSQSYIYIKEHNIVIALIKDITREEKQQQHIYKLREETIDMAQRVIDNQMIVAQQIASLLGETTAETKVTLTKLKDSVLKKEGE
ncbi:MAG: [Fe-Fe] hydrogenase large subunit C-terminal domain-containing protein [Clostridia bacterium]|nr:[Fe-Fe] hydrogenase large subunit C-terminal domain-containing protein [Clostridia bacterium]